MLSQEPGSGAPASHPLLDEVRKHLDGLKVTLDSAEIQFLDGDLARGGRAYTFRLVRVRVNGHDAVDGIVEDVTSLRRADLEIHRLNAELEQRIVERTRQLQDANEALETFGFSVSHDLREPLRTIQGYADALRQDFNEGRTADLGLYVNRIAAVAQRVDSMVSDLLEFARLSRTEIAIDTVLVADAVKDVQATLLSDPYYARAEVLVEAAGELAVRAHRQTFVQALTNLVSNAVKFVEPGVTAQVKVGAHAHGDMVRIGVRDNGIGIPDEAHGRIFNVFERLHSEEEFPGTGIGLAIVKKGIERMGGTVGVDAHTEGGSSFYIDLPQA
jgi:signal transduction histidine kinase